MDAPLTAAAAHDGAKTAPSPPAYCRADMPRFALDMRAGSDDLRAALEGALHLSSRMALLLETPSIPALRCRDSGEEPVIPLTMLAGTPLLHSRPTQVPPPSCRPAAGASNRCHLPPLD
jgi:hypothetical protein